MDYPHCPAKNMQGMLIPKPRPLPFTPVYRMKCKHACKPALVYCSLVLATLFPLFLVMLDPRTPDSEDLCLGSDLLLRVLSFLHSGKICPFLRAQLHSYCAFPSGPRPPLQNHPLPPHLCPPVRVLSLLLLDYSSHCSAVSFSLHSPALNLGAGAVFFSFPRDHSREPGIEKCFQGCR